MGINGHFHFKPELYRQTCALVRNYHSMSWDVAKPGDRPTLPLCVNKVDWDQHVYGAWKRTSGFETSLCATFDAFGRDNKQHRELWKGQEAWITNYGRELATTFGESGRDLVTSIEIGNEPGGGPKGFDEALYRTLFQSMARGIRAGDPAMKIVTCAAHTRDANEYIANLDTTFASPESLPLFDAISVHVYAQFDPEYPLKPNRGQWDRTYPEDEAVPYVETVREVIDWRDTKAPDKEIWITEFGWDSATQAAIAQREGWAKKLNWQGVTDLQQAQYLVRSFLLFAAMDVDRAYLFFYNDDDKASVHGASGLTRNFEPKPSFWAVRQMHQRLGDYRFEGVIKQSADLMVYSFRHGADLTKQVWVVWRPTGPPPGQAPTIIPTPATLTGLPDLPTRVEGMATAKGTAPPITWKPAGKTGVVVPVGESPIYLSFE